MSFYDPSSDYVLDLQPNWLHRIGEKGYNTADELVGSYVYKERWSIRLHIAHHFDLQYLCIRSIFAVWDVNRRSSHVFQAQRVVRKWRMWDTIPMYLMGTSTRIYAPFFLLFLLQLRVLLTMVMLNPKSRLLAASSLFLLITFSRRASTPLLYITVFLWHSADVSWCHLKQTTTHHVLVSPLSRTLAPRNQLSLHGFLVWFCAFAEEGWTSALEPFRCTWLPAKASFSWPASSIERTPTLVAVSRTFLLSCTLLYSIDWRLLQCRLWQRVFTVSLQVIPFGPTLVTRALQLLWYYGASFTASVW